MEKFENPLRVEKKQRVPTYNMTLAQLDKIRDDARREGIPDAIYICNSMYSAAMLIALRDTFGFGTDRLKRAFYSAQNYFDQLYSGNLQWRDVSAALRDECGINLIIERTGNSDVDVDSMFRSMQAKLSGYHIKIKE